MPEDQFREILRDELRKVAPAQDEWLDAGDVAKILRCTRDHVARLARLEGLPSHPHGRRRLFKRAEVSTWLEGRK